MQKAVTANVLQMQEQSGFQHSTEWRGLEGTSADHLQPTAAALGYDTNAEECFSFRQAAGEPYSPQPF